MERPAPPGLRPKGASPRLHKAAITTLTVDVSQQRREHQMMNDAVSRMKEMSESLAIEPNEIAEFSMSFVNGVNSSLYRKYLNKVQQDLKFKELEANYAKFILGKQELEKKVMKGSRRRSSLKTEPRKTTPNRPQKVQITESDLRDILEEEDDPLATVQWEDPDAPDSETEAAMFIQYLGAYTRAPSAVRLVDMAARASRACAARSKAIGSQLNVVLGYMGASNARRSNTTFLSVYRGLQTSLRKTNHALDILKAGKQFIIESNASMATLQCDTKIELDALRDRLAERTSARDQLKSFVERKREYVAEREREEVIPYRTSEEILASPIKDVKDFVLGSRHGRLLRLLSAKFERQLDTFFKSRGVANPNEAIKAAKKKKERKTLKTYAAATIKVLEQQRLVQMGAVKDNEQLQEEKMRREVIFNEWVRKWLGEDFESVKLDPKSSITYALMRLHKNTRVFTELITHFLADKDTNLTVNEEDRFWREWSNQTGNPINGPQLRIPDLQLATAVIPAGYGTATMLVRACLALLGKLFLVCKTVKLRKMKEFNKYMRGQAFWQLALTRRTTMSALNEYRKQKRLIQEQQSGSVESEEPGDGVTQDAPRKSLKSLLAATLRSAAKATLAKEQLAEKPESSDRLLIAPSIRPSNSEPSSPAISDGEEDIAPEGGGVSVSRVSFSFGDNTAPKDGERRLRGGSRVSLTTEHE